MRFLRVYKTFRGGRKDGWIIIPEWAKEEADIKYLATYWAEQEGSGSNYGWTVHWEFGTPPMEWLQKELKRAIDIVNSKQEYVQLVIDAIEKARE